MSKLLQISEPGESTTSGTYKLAVGIDLGTTNSLIARVDPDSCKPYVITDQQQNELLPSAVRFDAEGIPSVGKQALVAAIVDNQNVILSSKRLMGRSRCDVIANEPESVNQFVDEDDPSAMVRLQTVAGEVSPIQVAAEILKALLQRVADQGLEEVQGAVITVPAYFDDAQRQATKDAAKIAGINVLRLLNEPTAAAIAYGFDATQEDNEDSKIVVYDLGGGTFDVSILTMRKGLFQVLATAGDSALGGDDFDRAIARWIASSSLQNWHQLNTQQHRQLMFQARHAKEQLTYQDTVIIDYNGATLELNQSVMKELSVSLIERITAVCQQVIADSNLDHGQIDHVIMVGGSTRMPIIREAVSAFFCRQPFTEIDPDKVVSMGAALQANVLIGNQSTGKDTLLLDVVPLSLGIEIMGGLTEKIIHRNSTIPISQTQQFTTAKNGQTVIDIHVLQGERELVKDCRSLAHLALRGIPPMLAGMACIDVTFQVDADGILSVTAAEKDVGTQVAIEIKPAYGLDDTMITQMLQDSLTHAKEDIAVKQLREQQTEARQLIDYLQQGLVEDGKTLLSSEENATLQQSINDLERLINDSNRSDQGDSKSIHQGIKELSALSENFATRRMNLSIKTMLKGKNLDTLNPS